MLKQSKTEIIDKTPKTRGELEVIHGKDEADKLIQAGWFKEITIQGITHYIKELKTMRHAREKEQIDHMSAKGHMGKDDWDKAEGFAMLGYWDGVGAMRIGDLDDEMEPKGDDRSSAIAIAKAKAKGEGKASAKAKAKAKGKGKGMDIMTDEDTCKTKLEQCMRMIQSIDNKAV